MVAMTESPIDVLSLLDEARDPAAGGIDIFVGAVRNHSDGHAVDRLEYTAYVPMAERIMADIEREIFDRWKVCRVVMRHRTGTLDVGEIAVVTIVAATHRREAFEACRYAIDELKKRVPIWKREILRG